MQAIPVDIILGKKVQGKGIQHSNSRIKHGQLIVEVCVRTQIRIFNAIGLTTYGQGFQQKKSMNGRKRQDPFNYRSHCGLKPQERQAPFVMRAYAIINSQHQNDKPRNLGVNQ